MWGKNETFITKILTKHSALLHNVAYPTFFKTLGTIKWNYAYYFTFFYRKFAEHFHFWKSYSFKY